MKNLHRARADFVEEELVSSVGRFIKIRWLAGLGVLAAARFVDAVLHLPLPATPLYLVGIAILVYNALFHIALRRLSLASTRDLKAFHRLAEVQIGLDWLAMTALVHFSGGVESPALFYFFFHIVIAGFLLPLAATFFYAAAATLLVGTVVLLEYLGWLPHVSLVAGLSLHERPVFVLGVMFFFASAMFVSAYLASTINDRLRTREREVVDLSENLQRAYDRLQTLYDSAQAITSTLELQQVLDRICQRTADAMEVRACSIRLLDETGTKLTVASVYGLSDAYVKKGDLILDENPLARQVLAGHVVTIADVRNDTRLQYPSHALAEGILSMLSAPLLGKRGPIGLIRAFSTEPSHFTDEDASFLTAMASEGSIAIENAIAYRALSHLDEMKSKFVLTVTHELRSPVGVVRSLLRTLEDGYTGPLTDGQRNIVNRVLHRAAYLQTLIDDLLDLAAGKIDLKHWEEHGAVQLDEAVTRVIARYETEAREKGLLLEYRTAGPVMIIATPEGVDRILDNLVSNAVKYTPGGGSISVTLSTENDMARVEVADTGIGIPEASLGNLFQEFYRAPNAKAQVKEGTGLGLAITKELVARYGGKITFQSEVGEGTTFVVTLPLAEKSRS